MPSATPPVILVIAGNDPTGGAGLTADTQTLAALGCHIAPVVSSVTVQDTVDARAVWPTGAERVVLQMGAVLDDMAVAAVKCGLLADAETVASVAALLADHPGLPLVVDPVLIAGGGAVLAGESVAAALRRELIPLATAITPNRFELRELVPEHGDDQARARALCDQGCRYVLVTGGDDSGSGPVENTLYGGDGCQRTFSWPRLPDRYHGSGCTLAAALTALLACGLSPVAAVEQAQDYTWRALRDAFRAGRGQSLPRRFGGGRGNG